MLSRAGKRHGALHRSIVVSVAAVALGAGASAAPAVAQDTPPEQQDVRTCRGTAVKTGNLVILNQGLRLASANNQETPCRTDRDEVANYRVPVKNTLLSPIGTLLGVHTGTLLELRAVEGLAVDDPASTAATGRVTYLKLNVLRQVIELHAVGSLARVVHDGECDDERPQGYSHVAALIVNGRIVFAGSNPQTIPLGPLGAIHLNQQTRDGNTLTQRAVFIDLPGESLDVAVAEAVAGVDCAEPEPEEPQGV